MTREELANLVKMDNSGTIFSVEFVKRTNGEVRNMTCRKGVTKYLKGVGRSYDFDAKNLLCVYDLQKNGYRMINLDTIRKVKMHGKEWEAVE